MSNKRGAYNKQKETSEDSQTNYMRGLSTSVGKACDVWLEKRGMKNKSWMQQKEEDFKKKQR